MNKSKKKIFLFNGNKIRNNTKFFSYENNLSFNNNSIDLKKYAKKYQKEWLDILDDWHHQVYLKNTKISWRWALTRSSRLEYIYPHHLNPLLSAVAVLNYLNDNHEDITLYDFHKEAIDYIKESYDNKSFQIIDNGIKKKYTKNTSTIKNIFKLFFKIFNLFYRKLYFLNSSKSINKNPDLLIISNTINLNTLNEKGDHFFGSVFDNVKHDINKFYIVDNFSEINGIKKNIFHKKNYTLNYEFLRFRDIFKIILLGINDFFIYRKFKRGNIPITIGNLRTKKFYKYFLSSSLNSDLIYETVFYYSFKNYLKYIKPKKIIYPYERKGFENALLNICKCFKEIETIGFAHAYYSNRHRYLKYIKDKNYYYPQRIALTGEIPLKTFIDKNWPNEKCFILGSPRYFENISHDGRYKKKNTILIIISYHFELKVITKWLIENASKLKKYKFVIRPYPHDWQELQLNYLSTLKNYPINFEFSSHTSIYEQFSKSNVVLFYSSSAGIEAMFSDAIAIKYEADELIKLYDEIQEKLEKIKIIKSSDQLVELLSTINSYSEKEIKHELLHQKLLSKNIYSKVDLRKIL